METVALNRSRFPLKAGGDKPPPYAFQNCRAGPVPPGIHVSHTAGDKPPPYSASERRSVVDYRAFSSQGGKK